MRAVIFDMDGLMFGMGQRIFKDQNRMQKGKCAASIHRC